MDNYDVFLIQSMGTKEWSIENCPLSPREELARELVGAEVRVLQGFAPTHTWTLEPGDMLYLPPRIPHHGIATPSSAGAGDSVTLSMGFRDPTSKDLVTAFGAHVAETALDGQQFFRPELKPEVCAPSAPAWAPTGADGGA